MPLDAPVMRTVRDVLMRPMLRGALA